MNQARGDARDKRGLMIEQTQYADQFSIETPEQVDLQFPIAGVGSRFIAVMIDHLIQAVPYVLLIIGLAIFAANSKTATAAGADKLDAAAKWVIAFFIFLNFLWIWGYFALFEGYWNGRTPGKYVMKLRVLKDSGRSITLFESMARNLLRFVDYLPSMYFTGVIAMLCNKQNKRLGDLAAGTIVVHERLAEQPLMRYADTDSAQSYTPQAQAARAAGETLLPADAVAKLKPEDLHVIETFFGRALDLDLQTRAQLAERMAERLAAKMGCERPAGMEAERMLELIAYRMRSSGRG